MIRADNGELVTEQDERTKDNRMFFVAELERIVFNDRCIERNRGGRRGFYDEEVHSVGDDDDAQAMTP